MPRSLVRPPPHGDLGHRGGPVRRTAPSRYAVWWRCGVTTRWPAVAVRRAGGYGRAVRLDRLGIGAWLVQPLYVAVELVVAAAASPPTACATTRSALWASWRAVLVTRARPSSCARRITSLSTPPSSSSGCSACSAPSCCTRGWRRAGPGRWPRRCGSSRGCALLQWDSPRSTGTRGCTRSWRHRSSCCSPWPCSPPPTRCGGPMAQCRRGWSALAAPWEPSPSRPRWPSGSPGGGVLGGRPRAPGAVAGIPLAGGRGRRAARAGSAPQCAGLTDGSTSSTRTPPASLGWMKLTRLSLVPRRGAS